MELDSREFQVEITIITLTSHAILNFTNQKKIQNECLGTSIGFKNIASKIAYDLRLWLGANDPPTKELLYEINDLDTTKPDNDNENEPGTKSSNKGIEQETTILKTWDALYRSIKQESEERSE